MYKLALALILSAGAIFAADVTGKWNGSFIVTIDGESRDDTAYLDLKQAGSKVTGTAGPRAEKQFPIVAGTIDGDKIKISVEEKPGNIIQIELTVDGEKMTGSGKAEHDGQTMTAKLDLKREK